jgi:hypothetical protein
VVITIEPTVTVMTPFDFGPTEGRSDNDVIYPTEPARCMTNHYMVNWIECGITAVYAPNMLWFSHDLKQQPTPIPWRDGRAELPLGNEVLVLTHDGASVRTERQLRSK